MSRLQPPKISVVTASYNQAQFLEQTLASVANQDYPNIEHIVIDGGSTDGSIDILRRWDERLSYWVSEPDQGQTHAINKGIIKASGDLIGFQNSDDLYLPGAFRKIAEASIANPEASLFYGDFLHIDADNEVRDEQLLGVAKLWIQVCLGPQIHNQAAFWRSSLNERIGFLDQKYDFDMDYEFFSRALANRERAIHIVGFLGAFRHHGSAKTANLQHISKQELKDVASRYRKFTKSRFLPTQITRPLAQIYKAIDHARKGRIDYLFRN